MINQSEDIIKILFLAANPDDTTKLRVDQEYRDVQEGIKRAKFRDRFELISRWAVRPKDLRRVLLDKEPHILHFAGHGEGFVKKQREEFARKRGSLKIGKKSEEDPFKNYQGGIILQDDNDNKTIISDKNLGQLIGLFENIKCVFLNACYSAFQAKELLKYVDTVIGMNQAVPDSTSIEFAVAFYDGLCAGNDIDFAFKYAKSAISLEGLPEADIPEIHKR